MKSSCIFRFEACAKISFTVFFLFFNITKKRGSFTYNFFISFIEIVMNMHKDTNMKNCMHYIFFSILNMDILNNATMLEIAKWTILILWISFLLRYSAYQTKWRSNHSIYTKKISRKKKFHKIFILKLSFYEKLHINILMYSRGKKVNIFWKNCY